MQDHFPRVIYQPAGQTFSKLAAIASLLIPAALPAETVIVESRFRN
jgi:hypothetical protein